MDINIVEFGCLYINSISQHEFDDNGGVSFFGNDDIFDINANIRISSFPIKDMKKLNIYHLINDSIKPDIIIVDNANRGDFINYGNSLVIEYNLFNDISGLVTIDNTKQVRNVSEYITAAIVKHINKKINSKPKSVIERINEWEERIMFIEDEMKAVMRVIN